MGLQSGGGNLRHLHIAVATITSFIVLPFLIILAIVLGRRLYSQLL